jgi:biotin carboxylase
MGVDAVVASDRRQALEGLQPERTLTLDLVSPERAARQILRFALDHPLAAIVPSDDLTAEVAAIAARRLRLPHNPPEAARTARRKDLLRRTLRAAGVPTPRYRLLPPAADPQAAAQDQAYPCVLKPTFLAASRGVIRADDAAGFAAAVRRIRAILALPEVMERGGGAEEPILVEEFIPGAEVALEGLLREGRLQTLAIFDKPDPLDGPFFEETIYVTPSRHPVEAQQAIEATAAAAARAIGLTEGPVHAELRLHAGEAWLIELAARSIGGLCSRALRFGTGMTLEEVILMHALGGDAGAAVRTRDASGVMMIPIPSGGILRAVGGQQEARAVPGVVDLAVSATLGRPIVPLPEGSSYLGFIFARAGSPAEVEAALREAHRRLRIVID